MMIVTLISSWKLSGVSDSLIDHVFLILVKVNGCVVLVASVSLTLTMKSSFLGTVISHQKMNDFVSYQDFVPTSHQVGIWSLNLE